MRYYLGLVSILKIVSYSSFSEPKLTSGCRLLARSSESLYGKGQNDILQRNT